MATTTFEGFDEIIENLDADLFRSPEELFLPIDFLTDPYSTFRAIRDRFGPVVERNEALDAGFLVPNPFLADESKPIFLALGYDAAMEVWRNAEVFSNSAYEPTAGVYFGGSLSLLDGAAHARFRALAQQAFRRSIVERWTTELVVPLAEHLVERLRQRGGGDLVRELAAPLPFKVMAAIMGLPDQDFGLFVGLTTDLLHIAYDPAAAMAAKEQLGAYFAEAVAERRRQPTDDLIGMLVSAELDGDRLGDQEIIDNLRQFLAAGIETTHRSTSNMFLQLLKHREQFEAVVADPTLVPRAVEEALRYDGPAMMNPRAVREDIDLAGVHLPAGSSVLASEGMANRDPSRWEDPDRFDVHRPPKPHAAFITGPHTCIGLHLARAQMQAALRSVIAGAPDLELGAPREEIVTVGFLLRAPTSCPVVVGPPAGAQP